MDKQGRDVCLDCGVPVSLEDWRCEACADKVLAEILSTPNKSSKLRSKAIKRDILGYDYSDLPELPSLARDRDKIGMLNDMMKTMDELHKMIHGSELEKWMVSQGYDPQEGGTLFISEEWKEQLEGVELPPFVCYSKHLKDGMPFMVKSECASMPIIKAYRIP